MDVGLEVVENPTCVGVPEAFQGAMGILLLVRIGMVLGMGGGPVQGGPLHGHRAADQKEGFQPRVGLKALVGEHPVVAQGDSVAAKGEEGEEEGEVNPGDVRVPQKDDCGNDPENRQPNQSQEDEFGKGSCRLSVGNGGGQGASMVQNMDGGKSGDRFSSIRHLPFQSWGWAQRERRGGWRMTVKKKIKKIKKKIQKIQKKIQKV